MMKLKHLVEEIKRDSKMTSEEMSIILAESIDEEDNLKCVFKKLYIKAYGEHLNKSIADSWVKAMDITDGSDRTTGEMWTYELTSEIGQKCGIDWTKINKFEWYAIMNAWYSDFYRTAKAYNHEKEPAFYASLVIDYFIKDTDAKNKSVFNYYVEHVM